MNPTDGLSASLEDYLEAIYHIIREKQAARVKDIAQRLHVRAASVTGALRSLAEKNLVNYAPYEIVTFTKQGEAAALDVVRRHTALKDFFTKVLLVDDTTADSAACQMEHCITRPLVNRLIQFAEFVESCPRAGTRWIRGFGYYCDHQAEKENCERCMRTNLEELLDEKQNTGDTPMQTQTLNKLKPGAKARILRVGAKGATAQRLVEMGMTAGTTIEVIKVAPLGDPFEIKLKGYHLSVRKQDAESIDVEPL